MADFISRKERNKSLITATNKEIEQLKKQDEADQYTSSILLALKQIDSKHFEEIKNELKNDFDSGNFFLGKDKSKEMINPEIFEAIKMHLEKIELMASANVNDSNKKHIKREYLLKENEFILDTYKDIYDALNDIQMNERNEFVKQEKQNSKGQIASQTVSNKLAIEYRKAFNDPSGNNKNVFNKGQAKMYADVVEIRKKKGRYKINIKWFIIAAPILGLVMLTAIIVPIII